MMRFWWATRRQAERELEDEVRGTLDMLRDEGLSPRAAAIALGGEDQVKEAVRAARSGAWLNAVGRDIRYGARRLRQRPGYTLAVVTVLGVGIGLATALFSAVNALVLRPLPFPQPQQLVTLQVSNYSVGGDALNGPMKPGLRQIFSGYAGYQPMVVNIAEGGPPARMRIAAVTADFFPMLGVHLARGQGFPASGFFYPKGYTLLQQAAPIPVVLGDALWHARYGAAPDIGGKLLLWGGVGYRVVGVAPPGFGFPEQAQAWIPYRDAPEGGLDGSLPTILGRLRPGLSFEAAESLMVSWAKKHGNSNAGDVPVLVPLQRQLLGNQRALVLLLWAASGLVLLLACAGAVGLGAGQVWARRRELALRLAIGAGAARIRRQLLTEGVMLGLLGGAVGWLVANVAGHWLAALWPLAVQSTRPALDGAAAAVAFALALICGIAVGLAGRRKQWTLDSERYGRGAGPVRARANEWLTAAQLALAVILLTATAALGHSWLLLMRVPTGINQKPVLAMEVSLPYQDKSLQLVPSQWKYFFGKHPERPTAADRSRLAQAEAVLANIRSADASLQQHAAALPGVESAGLLGYLPFGEAYLMQGEVHKPGAAQNNESDYVFTNSLRSGPGALTALGIHFVAGHDFSAGDAPACETIYSESLLRALGYTAIPATVTIFPRQTCQLVGVVDDVRLSGSRAAPVPTYYTPLNRQYPDASPVLIVRAKSGVPPLSLLPGIRKVLAQIAPDAAISHINTLDDLLNRTHADLNQATTLFGLFALLAAAIAGLSVFALAMQTAIARTREIGVRMVLGAEPADIRRWMLGRQGWMTLGALLVAFPLSWLLERALGQWLYHVTPGSGLSYAIAAVALGLLVLAAAWWPAHRAALVAPVEALRHE